jgi:hypothetical protein
MESNEMKKFAIMSLALAVGFGIVLTADSFLTQEQTVMSPMWAFYAETPTGLIAHSDLIVVADHQKAAAGRQEGNLGFTNNTFEISSILKGTHNGSSLLLEQTGNYTQAKHGAAHGGVVLDSHDGGEYLPGTTYVLFLKDQGNGMFYLINPQGRYELDNGTLTGVDGNDNVVKAFNGKTINAARTLVKERVEWMK